jgi:hypothetical protein
VVALAVKALPVEHRLKPCEAPRRHAGEFDEPGGEMRLIKVAALGRQLGPADSRSAPPQRQRTVKSNEPESRASTRPSTVAAVPLTIITLAGRSRSPIKADKRII